MKNPGSCDDDSNDKNREKAMALVGEKLYAPVDVSVVSSDHAQKVIVFRAKGKDGKLKVQQAKWGDLEDMWAPCPSSLPSSAQAEDPGPPAKENSSGALYLSSDYIAQEELDAPMPKWPRYLGVDGPYLPMDVWPLKLELTAVQVETGEEITATIDLLDPDLAKRGQTLTTDHKTMTLMLSKEAFGLFDVRFEAAWSQLPQAVEVIKHEHKNPDAIRAAWEVVSACVSSKQQRQNKMTDNHLALLRSVLPDLELG